MYRKLQYISQGATAKEQQENIAKALDAGCNWIQLRFKDATEDAFLELGQNVAKHCKSYNATFIVNDNVAIARQLDADGVHLGLEDMHIADARYILGIDKIIGGTANTLEHIISRVNKGCDYIGLGPLRFTTTKAKLSPVLGLEGYKAICDSLQENNIVTPIYAIGGVEASDVQQLMDIGIYGIAVSGIISKALQAKALVESLNNSLYESVENWR